MPEHHVSVLLELAGTPELGPEAAELLSAHPNGQVRALVLHHPNTTETSRTRRMRDRNVTVQRAALSTTSDTTALAATEDTPVEKAVGIAGNPLTQPETLGLLLNHPHIRVVREAMGNPSSPVDEVKAVARRTSMDELFAAGVTSIPIASASWVVDAHPEVAPIWAKGASNPALRVLAYHDRLLTETAETLAGRRRGAWIRHLIENPATPEKLAKKLGATQPRSMEKRETLQGILDGDTLRRAAADPARRLELARTRTHCADRLLAQQEDLGETLALDLVSRTEVDEQVEGKTLTLLVQRYGGEIAEIAISKMSASRIVGAANRTALLEHHTRYRGAKLIGRRRAQNIINELGDDRGRWETFLALLTDWERDAEQLAETTRSL